QLFPLGESGDERDGVGADVRVGGTEAKGIGIAEGVDQGAVRVRRAQAGVMVEDGPGVYSQPSPGRLRADGREGVLLRAELRHERPDTERSKDLRIRPEVDGPALAV